MKTFLRVLLLLSGIITGAVGIYSILNPGVTLLSLSLAIGLALLFSGIIGIIAFFRVRKQMYKPGWLLVTSLLDLLMGMLVLFTPAGAALAASLPLALSLWIIFRGIFVIVESFSLKGMHESEWWVSLLFGILSTAAGVISLMNPVIAAVTISVLVGIELITMAITTLVVWWRWVQAHRAVKKLQKAAREDWDTFARKYPESTDFIRSIIDQEFLDL
jgi:uncharacterized membrane protein HdeD (DUF308 family)